MSTVMFVPLIYLIIITNQIFGQIDSSNLPSLLSGVWYLHNRIGEKGSTTINLPNKSPIRCIRIENCNDSFEIIRFPENIKKMRLVNPLRNVRFIEYDTLDHVVDTIYPVARIKNDSLLFISSFGIKYKKYYHINRLAYDTMVIDRTDVYIKKSVD